MSLLDLKFEDKRLVGCPRKRIFSQEETVDRKRNQRGMTFRIEETGDFIYQSA
jgi:hypothetical protein